MFSNEKIQAFLAVERKDREIQAAREEKIKNRIRRVNLDKVSRRLDYFGKLKISRLAREQIEVIRVERQKQAEIDQAAMHPNFGMF